MSASLSALEVLSRRSDLRCPAPILENWEALVEISFLRPKRVDGGRAGLRPWSFQDTR